MSMLVIWLILSGPDEINSPKDKGHRVANTHTQNSLSKSHNFYGKMILSTFFA